MKKENFFLYDGDILKVVVYDGTTQRYRITTHDTAAIELVPIPPEETPLRDILLPDKF